MPAARELLMRRMASNGVTVVDPVNTYIDPRSSIAPGVTLLPGTILRGHTAIGSGCEIGPNAMVRDCIVGEGPPSMPLRSTRAPSAATPPWGPSPMSVPTAASATTAGWGTSWR